MNCKSLLGHSNTTQLVCVKPSFASHSLGACVWCGVVYNWCFMTEAITTEGKSQLEKAPPLGNLKSQACSSTSVARH